MSEEIRFNKYEMAKMSDQIIEGGFHFERDLPEGRRVEIMTPSGPYVIESKDEGLYIHEQNSNGSKDPYKIKIYSIPPTNGSPSVEKMEPNYIRKGDRLEILLTDLGKEIHMGPIENIKLLPES